RCIRSVSVHFTVPTNRLAGQTGGGKSLMGTLKNAVVAAVLAGIIIAPIYGVQIVRQGMQSRLEPDWKMVLIGMGIVFVFQLVRPFLARHFARPGKTSFSLPVVPEPVRRGLIVLLIAIALVWPF